MSISRNENTRNWDVVFDDLSTRSFDGRFTEEQVFSKAVRYQNGTDGYLDGLYDAAT